MRTCTASIDGIWSVYAAGNQSDPQNAYTIMTRMILAF